MMVVLGRFFILVKKNDMKTFFKIIGFTVLTFLLFVVAIGIYQDYFNKYSIENRIKNSEYDNSMSVTRWAYTYNSGELDILVELVNSPDSLYAKVSWHDGSYSYNRITKSIENGKTRYDFPNDHGEYYMLEENGNLGFYGNDGKFQEARRWSSRK
jgi:hypothetical protein